MLEENLLRFSFGGNFTKAKGGVYLIWPMKVFKTFIVWGFFLADAGRENEAVFFNPKVAKS